MAWWHALLDAEEGLDGPLNLRPPRNLGRMRPGRRSVELALEAEKKRSQRAAPIPTGAFDDRRNTQRAAPIPTGAFDDRRNTQRAQAPQKAPGLVRRIRSSPEQRALVQPIRRTPPPQAQQRRVATPAPNRRTPPPQTQQRRLVGLSGPLPPGTSLEDLFTPTGGDDSTAPEGVPTGPEIGNGSVWVSDVAVQLQSPMLWRNTRFPLAWPDGTPARSRIWLPAVAMQDWFSPVAYVLDSNPAVSRYGLNMQSEGLWVDSGAAAEFWGSRAWEYVIFPWEEPRRDPLSPTPTGANSPPDWTGLDVQAQVNAGRAIITRDVKGQPVTRLFNSFDWSTQNPTTRAYAWCYLNIQQNAWSIPWTKMPADLYRYDLQPGAPARLPPLAWLSLDFLDGIQTGAHGFPILVKTGGGGGKVLDHAALDAFLQTPAGKEWAPLILDPRGDSMLAIIYDVDRVLPELVPDDGSRGWDPQRDRADAEADAEEEPIVDEEPVVAEEVLVDEQQPPDPLPDDYTPDYYPPGYDYTGEGNYPDEYYADEYGEGGQAGDVIDMLQALLDEAGPGVIAGIMLELLDGGSLTADEVFELIGLLDPADAVFAELAVLLGAGDGGQVFGEEEEW
jgi:hypothetical protein